jgi:hypothetical protein
MIGLPAKADRSFVRQQEILAELGVLALQRTPFRLEAGKFFET